MKTDIYDLRTFIKRLDEEGELARIKAEVDWKYELGAIAIKVYGPPPGPALLFENVKDYTTPVFTGGLHTIRRIAMALGLDPQIEEASVLKECIKRLETPIEPVIVEDGPCKENKYFDNEVDVLKFPVPRWDERDGGRYIGTWHQVITKDPDTGWSNVGPYKMMVHEPNLCSMQFGPSTHMGLIYSKYEKMKRPMPVAVSIGTDPICMLVAGWSFPAGVDEWYMASALRQRPLELVKCETVDLEIPSHAEIVLEGEVPPFETRPAGPMANHTGYLGTVKPYHVLKVKCVTHRNYPIFRGTTQTKPSYRDEVLRITSLTRAAEAYMMYKRAGFPGVSQVNCPVGPDPYFIVIIAINKTYASQGLDAARLFLSSRLGRYTKHVIVVDDDINIFDLEEVFWAINCRFQAGRDLYITRNETASELDPSVPRELSGFTDKMIMDATWPKTPDFKPRDEWGGKTHPPETVPSESLWQLIENRWKEYGLG